MWDETLVPAYIELTAHKPATKWCQCWLSVGRDACTSIHRTDCTQASHKMMPRLTLRRPRCWFQRGLTGSCWHQASPNLAPLHQFTKLMACANLMQLRYCFTNSTAEVASLLIWCEIPLKYIKIKASPVFPLFICNLPVKNHCSMSLWGRFFIKIHHNAPFHTFFPPSKWPQVTTYHNSHDIKQVIENHHIQVTEYHHIQVTEYHHAQVTEFHHTQATEYHPTDLIEYHPTQATEYHHTCHRITPHTGHKISPHTGHKISPHTGHKISPHTGHKISP